MWPFVVLSSVIQASRVGLCTRTELRPEACVHRAHLGWLSLLCFASGSAVAGGCRPRAHNASQAPAHHLDIDYLLVFGAVYSNNGADGNRVGIRSVGASMGYNGLQT